jgi:hypothetical protein
MYRAGCSTYRLGLMIDRAHDVVVQILLLTKSYHAGLGSHFPSGGFDRATFLFMSNFAEPLLSLMQWPRPECMQAFEQCGG